MTSGEPSVISADLKLIGNVHSAGDVQVDGTIEGDINSRSLTVGEGARIDGSITADHVRICGSVSGQVQ
ncbi:MAG: polymer-forming cytoskeletal protein, partial [Alphaproteobacteria bacterium]